MLFRLKTLLSESYFSTNSTFLSYEEQFADHASGRSSRTIGRSGRHHDVVKAAGQGVSILIRHVNGLAGRSQGYVTKVRLLHLPKGRREDLHLYIGRARPWHIEVDRTARRGVGV